MKKFLLLLLVASACTPTYVPNIRNSPMFGKGGEFQASVSVGNGIEAQSAVSITNHIGLMANYSYMNREDFEVEEIHRHRIYEGGVGYFTNKDKVFFEVFAGYGRGEGTNFDNFDFLGTPDKVQAEGKYERYFIQPAIGVNKKVFDFAFVQRVSVVDFSEFSYGADSYKMKTSPYVFLEPAFIGRVNTLDNHLFFSFQIGFSTPIDREPYFDHRGLQCSTGIGFRLGGFKTELTERQR
jgi:hypothetical protein